MKRLIRVVVLLCLLGSAFGQSVAKTDAEIKQELIRPPTRRQPKKKGTAYHFWSQVVQ
jgi:hypothetical protein